MVLDLVAQDRIAGVSAINLDAIAFAARQHFALTPSAIHPVVVNGYERGISVHHDLSPRISIAALAVVLIELVPLDASCGRTFQADRTPAGSLEKVFVNARARYVPG
jgi:hypothetical protein